MLPPTFFWTPIERLAASQKPAPLLARKLDII
jgi:hypothetical protein